MTSTEKSNVLRQLLDIQIQADRLIEGSPSTQDVEHFNQYAQELKYYCLENIQQDDIQRLLHEIPEVEMTEDYATIGCLSLFLPTIALALFFGEQGKNKAKDEIRIVKEKFAHVEFFSKNFLK